MRPAVKPANWMNARVASTLLLFHCVLNVPPATVRPDDAELGQVE